MRKKEQKYKIWLFLGSYIIFRVIRLLQLFFTKEERLAAGMGSLSIESAWGRRLQTLAQLSLILIWGICFVLNMTMARRNFFRSKAVKVLFSGIFIWLVWGVFITFGGLALFNNSDSYLGLRGVILFSTLLLMAARVVTYYDLRQEIVGITVFAIGTTLLYAYVTHFNGLDFVGSLSGIFKAEDRYRVSFGIVHYNTTGNLCLHYYIFMAIYRAILKEKYVKLPTGGGGMKRDALYTYLVFLSPIVFIMLLSTASRTSLSGLMLFWMVYWTLGNYQKVRGYIKAMIITLAIFVVIIAIVLVDWWAIWDVFWYNRGMNYASTFPILTAKNTWLTGLGFGFSESLNRMRTYTLLDSFYLGTLLQSGVIGFLILIGTFFLFAFLYFRDTRYMTRQQRLVGGLLAMMLYYGLFEFALFGNLRLFYLVNWILVILNANDIPRLKEEVHNHNK